MIQRAILTYYITCWLIIWHIKSLTCGKSNLLRQKVISELIRFKPNALKVPEDVILSTANTKAITIFTIYKWKCIYKQLTNPHVSNSWVINNT